jgi:hypothetical protein
VEDLMKNGTYEVFVAHLLLTAPTDLLIAWSNSQTAREGKVAVEAELKKLNFSEEARESIRDVTQQHWGIRKVFKGVADGVGAALYSGSEPHPELAQLNVMIETLGALK